MRPQRGGAVEPGPDPGDGPGSSPDAPGFRLAHNPALDGLRGAAVAGVLAFHAGHLVGGYLGVDLFFVLSGYLVTSLLVLEWRGTGRISLRAFWGRRARRLLPALLAVLVAVGLAAHSNVPSVNRGQLRGEGLATLAYVANWFSIVRGAGYWDRTLLPSWLQHTWSLAIEEQFYVLWPPLVVGLFAIVGRRRARPAGPPGVRAARRATRRLAVVAAGGALASGGLMIAWSVAGRSTQRLYLGTDTRAAAILLGAFVGCRQLLVAPGRRGVAEAHGRRALAVVGLISAAGLALAWSRLDGTSPVLYRGGLLACGVGATLVVLDVTTPGPSPLHWVLSAPPLRWLGAISYGLYLWHWPIFQYLHVGWHGLRAWDLVAVRIAASLVVAVVSYLLIEQPVRRGRLGPVAPRVLTPVALAVAVLALVLGTRGALDPVIREPKAVVARSYSRGPASAPRVLVVGDSVAYALAAEGLVPHAAALGLRVADGASVGCSIMVDGDSSDGVTHNCSGSWPALVAFTRPDLVLVLFGALAGMAPRDVGGSKAWPCEPAYDQRWRQRLDAAVSVLSAQGATVVLASAPTTTGILYKGEDPEAFDRRQQCSNRVLAEVAHASRHARFVDLAAWTCPRWPTCTLSIDGAELRPDGLHFRGPGAQPPARWLAAQLLAVARLR